MIGKYSVPFALSGAAALVVACLGISKLYAAEREAPAVLNFATSYSQQQLPPPRSPELPSVNKKPEKKVRHKQKKTPATALAERSQLAALQRDIVDKTRKIAQKNGEINALEQQIVELKRSATAPTAADASLHLTPADKQTMLDLVKDLRQVFSLTPTHSSLVAKLAQVKDQLKEAQLAESALRSQLKAANDGKDHIVSVQEETLKQQIEQYNARIAELEAHLSSSRQDIEKITAERDDIKAKEQKLAAENASEKQTFDKEKQQLLAQITQGSSSAEGQLAESVKQQQALQQQIEQHNARLKELEAQLSSSRQDIEKITAERDDLKAKEQKLTAENASEKQAFDKEKQQLLAQITLGSSSAEGQLAESVKQQQALQQQIEQYNARLTELEAQLSSSRQDIEKITAERDDIKAKEQKLAAENASEKQAFDKEKQQLLAQIAQGSGTAEGQLAESVKQQQALQQQLSEAQQLKTTLQDNKDRLLTQLKESQLIAKSLQTKIDQLQLQQTAAVSTTGTAPDETPKKEGNQEDDKKLPALQAKLDAALTELAAVKKQKPDMKSINTLPGITPEQLKKKSAREGYAIGISLGDEILQMQQDNNNWGTATEKNIVLAGIVDAFQGKPKLPTDILRNTLSEVSKRENKDQETLVTHLDETTKKYLKSFTKKKGTKKSPSGFWYNIIYEGDEVIPENATLDIVVKESLTNGNVITDMDANGTMLTQPLTDFPPVFREALQKLKNHGSITIVVPPELAYKDKGFPPKIPPNATMIYELRIANIYP